MNLQRYPEQEPLSPLGAGYAQRVLLLGQGVHGIEVDHGSDPYQTLTVFPADRPSGDVLVFFHGGGWTNGYKEWMYFMARALNAQGVTFVSAGYRLAPAHVFPAGLEDCADAMAWVLQHIGEHGGNGERVFVGGHSAGGHYAALLAVTAGWRSVRGLPAQALAGCLPVSGVYRFGEGSGLSVRPRFLGAGAPGEAEAAASPLNRIEAAACPPFLLTLGERDFPHLVAQSAEMAAALGVSGVSVRTEILEGCDHFEASLACGDPQRTWAAQAASWMRQRGR
jgi:acetyl esterase/lipase